MIYFSGMGSMRGSGTALAQLTRGNSSSPSMSAGTFMGFNSTVGGGRLTPTVSSTAANAVAQGFSAGKHNGRDSRFSNHN